jgi:hypothetical protein
MAVFVKEKLSIYYVWNQFMIKVLVLFIKLLMIIKGNNMRETTKEKTEYKCKYCNGNIIALIDWWVSDDRIFRGSMDIFYQCNKCHTNFKSLSDNLLNINDDIRKIRRINESNKKSHR